MKKYEYILLDWDGNLAKTLDAWLDAFQQVLEKRGMFKTEEEIGASFGASIAHLAAWGFEDPDAAMDEADAIVKKELPNVELYPDALAVLERLYTEGKKMALITSSTHENVDHLLKKYDIAHFFEVVIALDDTVHHKPHPEPLERALEALGGTKETAVMIGDSDKDLGAARNFGIDSVLFYPAEHKKFYNLEKLKELEPTYVFDDFKDVLTITL